MRELKFGVFLPFYAYRPEETHSTHFDFIRNTALECERLGYHSVWLDDHLMFKSSSILECWTALSALATLTNRIRLGTMVTCNTFRNPALLAKMAATVDVISNGRLEFAIGAGVQEAEHTAYGLQFPKLSARIGRLNEAVEIIKKMWTEEKASYSGEYYSIDGAVCEPKPVQKPHPPITIAGSGEKMTLRVTAQHADRFDWGYLPSTALYKHKLEVLQQYCTAVGRDFKEIEKSCWPGAQVFIASDRKELEKKLSERKPENVSLKDFEKLCLAGTPDECSRVIQEYADLGATFFMLFFGDLPSLEGLELFAETVARKLK
ncbi:TIGR03560 family F420-dependent LLM class oxidoreductase [Candidatus Bathyarchaeota archaeon A05DMB-2]|nr:TIGR03560 family F420-dependent LLM class oxidoreductase [Candidatus Bathyarchaeota archaeon A05DMB-2]